MELESWVQIGIMSNILEIGKIDIMGKILLFWILYLKILRIIFLANSIGIQVYLVNPSIHPISQARNLESDTFYPLTCSLLLTEHQMLLISRLNYFKFLFSLLTSANCFISDIYCLQLRILQQPPDHLNVFFTVILEQSFQNTNLILSFLSG